MTNGVPAGSLGGVDPAGWSPVRCAIGHVAGASGQTEARVIDTDKITSGSSPYPQRCASHTMSPPSRAPPPWKVNPEHPAENANEHQDDNGVGRQCNLCRQPVDPIYRGNPKADGGI